MVWYIAVTFCVVLTIAVSLTILGALGPPVTVVEEFGFKECDIKVEKLGVPFVDSEVCQGDGRPPEMTSRNNHIYYVTIPIKRTHREMSRWYQYLLSDVMLALKHDYLKKMKEIRDTSRSNFVVYEVAIGYRDSDSTKWKMLTSGNSTRALDCSANKWDVLSCDHFPLFELWSCHYKHYLINVRFWWFPYVHEYKENTALTEVNLFEIHQHPIFTYWWFLLKTVCTAVSMISLLYATRMVSSLLKKLLVLLNCCLVIFNISPNITSMDYFLSLVPIEWISLYFNAPWITPFNDIRQGLLIITLLTFWVFLIESHDASEGVVTLGRRWKQLLLAISSGILFLVYEFCERGIQVLYPFYSLWGSHITRNLTYVFVSLAVVLSVLYMISLVVSMINIQRKIKRKLKESDQLSETARSHLKSKMSQLTQYLWMTVLLAAFSVCGYLLPAELFLLQALHGYTHLSIYGAILLGNYGLWNSYIVAVTFLTANQFSTLSSGQQLLIKTSSQ